MKSWVPATGKRACVQCLKRLPIVLIALTGLSTVPAQTSFNDEWPALRAEAVQLFARGDTAGASALAARVAQLSTDRYGAGDWRAVADQLRATYFAGGAVGTLPTAQAQPGIDAASDPAARALAEDIMAFFTAIRATGSRDLLRPADLSLQADAPVPAVSAAPNGTDTDRVALVMGNNEYRNPGVPKLNNAINDATAVRQELINAGFTVTLIQNADLAQMKGAIDGFISRLRPGSTALVYYAGHAIQIQSENFLIPVDFNVSEESQAKADLLFAVSAFMRRW